MRKYDPKEVELEVLKHWEESKIYEKAVQANQSGEEYYFLDGPPYTTGEIHVGHAWNKALKDVFLRYKRQRGFNVRDQPGFDMHGLPIEVKVEEKLGLKDKREILTKVGLDRFIKECEEFAVDNMHPMIRDFKRMGVWMDWKKPYTTITNQYIEGAWWALKKAQEKGLLYRGLKTMTWCARCATALAKHELEYENVKDNSIFVKFRVKGEPNDYLVIWTTTPWTIPFNLGVMAHPEFDYVRANVGDETWILAKGLAPSVIRAVADRTFTVEEEFKGDALKGLEYEHPFAADIPQYKKIKAEAPNTHTVILTDKYVDLSAGSGLVHTAPGCGPEDFEVGRANGIPPFNNLDEMGYFPTGMGVFSRLKAKDNDSRFVEELRKRGALIAETPVEHDYAHCWRCKKPVIFRATDQWFLSVERLKQKMLKDNEEISWVPDWAGSRWFRSWLGDLQDWCISRQRFWGIPLPIWRCDCGEIRLMESAAEIHRLTGEKLENLHKPWIDDVKLPCRCGKTMTRVEDVLDVWLDSGASPWATLGYPNDKRYERLQQADFILEGKDQIRGWFNSLMCLSQVSFGRPSYKAVYMHGMIMDSQGRKMSKSLKNVISPYEVIDEYGADVMRYYMVGGAKAGLDLNYNFDDLKVKHRNVTVLWNLHYLLLDLIKTARIKPGKEGISGLEESYIISKLHSAIAKVSGLFEEFQLHQIPSAIEELYLELSRTYVQSVREKMVQGSEDEKQAIITTLYSVLFETLRMLAPLTPFIAEYMYLNLKQKLGLEQESIHLCRWPKYDPRLIDAELEESMQLAKDVIAAVLAVRDKIGMGVRWPLQEFCLQTKDPKVKQAVERLKDIILTQTNIREIADKVPVGRITMKADYAKLGPKHGADAPKIIASMALVSPESVLNSIERKAKFELEVNGSKIDIVEDDLIVQKEMPDHWAEMEFPHGVVYVNKKTSVELETEGYARELMRRIQSHRKKAGLHKSDSIGLIISTDIEMKAKISAYANAIAKKVGASSFSITAQEHENKEHGPYHEKIKGVTFTISFDAL